MSKRARVINDSEEEEEEEEEDKQVEDAEEVSPTAGKLG